MRRDRLLWHPACWDPGLGWAPGFHWDLPCSSLARLATRVKSTRVGTCRGTVCLGETARYFVTTLKTMLDELSVARSYGEILTNGDLAKSSGLVQRWELSKKITYMIKRNTYRWRGADSNPSQISRSGLPPCSFSADEATTSTKLILTKKLLSGSSPSLSVAVHQEIYRKTYQKNAKWIRINLPTISKCSHRRQPARTDLQHQLGWRLKIKSGQRIPGSKSFKKQLREKYVLKTSLRQVALPTASVPYREYR